MTRTVVQPKRSGLALIAALSGAISILWLWLAFAAVSVRGLSEWVVFPVSVLAAATFGWISWWAIRRRANEEPAMIIDEVGIYDNVSIAQAGRLKWREMERVWVAGPTWMRFLCAMPNNPRGYIDQQDDVRGMLMRLNKGLLGAPMVIPMAILDLPADDVWNRVALTVGSRAEKPVIKLATGA